MTYELMNTEQLDSVSGGTNGEYKEIRKLLPKIYYTDEYDTHQGVVIETISSAGNPNVYIRNGQRLTHSKVIAEIHNYFGK